MHKFDQVTPPEIREVLFGTSLDKWKVNEACEKLYYGCPIRAMTGIPVMRGKVSTSHVNVACHKDL